MGSQESLRSRVVSLVISALDQISSDLGIEVRLEGSRLTVTADLAGVKSATAKDSPDPAVIAKLVDAPKRRPGRSPGKKNKKRNPWVAKPLPDTAKLSADAKEAIDALQLQENVNGLNLSGLAKASGRREKALLKPVVKELLDGGFIAGVAGGRYRAVNAPVSVGRKAKGAVATAKAASAASPGKNKADKPTNTGKAAKAAKPASSAKGKAPANKAAKKAKADTGSGKRISKRAPAAKKVSAKQGRAAAPKKAAPNKPAAKNSVRAPTASAVGDDGHVPQEESRKSPESAS